MKRFTIGESISAVGASLGVILVVVWYLPGSPLIPPSLPAKESSESAREMRPSVNWIRQQLVDTIKSQLAAFRENDYVKAYRYAAPGIRGNLSLSDFEAMVKKDYAEIAQWADATFGEVQDDGGTAVANVTIKGPAGKFTTYRYLLIRETGYWKITGVVRINEKPEKGIEVI
jgi:hypothetical protein